MKGRIGSATRAHRYRSLFQNQKTRSRFIKKYVGNIPTMSAHAAVHVVLDAAGLYSLPKVAATCLPGPPVHFT